MREVIKIVALVTKISMLEINSLVLSPINNLPSMDEFVMSSVETSSPLLKKLKILVESISPEVELQWDNLFLYKQHVSTLIFAPSINPTPLHSDREKGERSGAQFATWCTFWLLYPLLYKKLLSKLFLHLHPTCRQSDLQELICGLTPPAIFDHAFCDFEFGALASCT